MKYVIVDIKRVNIRKTPAGSVIGYGFKNEIFPYIFHRDDIPYYQILYKGISAYITTKYTRLIEITKYSGK